MILSNLIDSQLIVSQFRNLSIAGRLYLSVARTAQLFLRYSINVASIFCPVIARSELTFQTDIGYLTISDFMADIISRVKSRFTTSRQTTLTQMAVGLEIPTS